ncbi:MAG TPA: hypothetical protein VEU62_12690 [Bryobacterales bacterium]|nr:hypothetical protein [Bryobacterales bacterium]
MHFPHGLLTFVAIAAVLVAVNRLMAPKQGTRLLVTTVWAALGPYGNAAAAARALRTSSKVGFGSDGAARHEGWIQGHVRNFRAWESAGDFARFQKIMRWGLLLSSSYGGTFRKTLKAVREERAVEEAGWINERIEKWGHRVDAVRRPDGSLHFVYKQTLSDEKIEQRKEEMALSIGAALWADESAAARRLLAFLSSVYEVGSGKKVENPTDLARVWLALLKLQEDGEEPRLVKGFEELRDPWIAQWPADGDEISGNTNSSG